MSKRPLFHLFDVTGIELEYMVVDRKSLKVLPIVDLLFRDVTGAITGDVDRGAVEWSNELVSHVVELKTAMPTPVIGDFRPLFHRDVREINAVLQGHGAMLLPTAAHPLMDPFTETVIWPHEYNEVYALYNRIFDCRGHGWSNLQSTHLNLPFADDDEFGRLHAAIRVLLPLIPAISASSPLLDGKPTGHLDARMHHYLHHQERIPQMMGSLIPERVFDKAAYTREIFDPIMKALSPFDTEKVMDRHFANSRGAIARFDRGAIEIRVIDIQECPSMDLSIAEMIVAVLRRLVQGEWTDAERYRPIDEIGLLEVFKAVIRTGGSTVIEHPELLACFGIQGRLSANELWSHLFDTVKGDLSAVARNGIHLLLEKGSAAERILKHTGPAPRPERIIEVYKELAQCLQEDRPLL